MWIEVRPGVSNLGNDTIQSKKKSTGSISVNIGFRQFAEDGIFRRDLVGALNLIS